eukprot:2338759-Pleurochrysis_carterae.AAC.1
MDNNSAFDLAYNPEYHQRSKHIDHRHSFVRKRVKSSHDITGVFVCSTENLEGFFTNPLGPPLFPAA